MSQWEWVATTHGGAEIRRKDNGELIAEVSCEQIDWETNARLFCAAPEMLVALKLVVQFLEQLGYHGGGAAPGAVAGRAIAKAEGRSKQRAYTMAELWAHPGTSDDFPENSEEYFIVRAIETHGSAVRDNTRAELIGIGERIDREGE